MVGDDSLKQDPTHYQAIMIITVLEFEMCSSFSKYKKLSNDFRPFSKGDYFVLLFSNSFLLFVELRWRETFVSV